MHYLYILFSEKTDRFYTGETSHVENRMNQHRLHYFKSGFTKAAADWKLMLKYCCQNKKDALYLERFIKRMKSKAFIQKIIDNPKILEEILAKR